MQLLQFRKKQNKPNEFHELVEEHLSGMYGVALRYTRNPQMAQDLVQDTIVRALRFQDRFEMGTNFKAWIYTILTRTFIHKYRRSKREREILDGVSRGDVTARFHSEKSQAASSTPEATYLHNVLSDDVLHALDDLPEDFRTVVVLCDIEGLSYKDIAEVVDCPVGTVMSRLYRGRRLLEKKLRQTAIEQGIIRPKLVEEPEVITLSEFRRQKREVQ